MGNKSSKNSKKKNNVADICKFSLLVIDQNNHIADNANIGIMGKNGEGWVSGKMTLTGVSPPAY